MILNHIDNLITFAESAGTEMIEKLSQYAAKTGAKAATTAAVEAGKKALSTGAHAAVAAAPKAVEKAASQASTRIAKVGVGAGAGYATYKGAEHLANAGTGDTASTAINAAAPVPKSSTHLATKPQVTSPVPKASSHLASKPHQDVVQHKVAAKQAVASKSQTLKSRFNRSDEIYQKNMAANKAKFDAQDAKDKADLAAKHAAVNSKLAAQKSLSKLPSQQAYKARFDSAASGNGPVPSQWYKDRPIKTD